MNISTLFLRQILMERHQMQLWRKYPKRSVRIAPKQMSSLGHRAYQLAFGSKSIAQLKMKNQINKEEENMC